MTDPLPTFSESWHRVAGQRIALHPAVRAARQTFRGERWIVLENPFNNQFHRLRPAAYEFVARLRPHRTVEEVWRECLEKFPDDAPGQEAVIQLLAQLYLAGLLQYDLADDAAKLFERYQKNQRRQTRARWLNIMFLRVPLLDPDRFLVRTLPVVGKFISGFGALLWLVVVGLGVKVALDHWPELLDQGQSVLAPDNLFLLYGGLILLKTLHEFGHAYVCRKFGGEVHVMGVLFMIFTPIPYVDATSSWSFRERWKRVLVGAAGMIVELFAAAVAALVWANTGQGTLHSLAYNMMFVASVSTLVFNLNPLLRFDGYYILSDLIGLPNLHQNSLRQLRHLAERHLFGLRKSVSPAQNVREKLWLTGFGITSGIYRVIIFGGILLFVADQFLIIGLVMALVCMVAWLVRPTVLFLRYLASSPALARNRPRAVAVSFALLALLLAVLNGLRFPSHFRAPGVLESRQWTEVLATAPGTITTLLAEPGARVTAGQPLLRLVNDELGFAVRSAQAGLEEVDIRLREALHGGIPNLKPLTARRESLEKQLQRLRGEQQALVVTARQDGIWVAPRIRQHLGTWLPKGAPLGLILDPERFDFVAAVAQEDADRMFADALRKSEVRLRGQAEARFAAGDLRILPAEKRTLPSPAIGWAAGGSIAVSPRDEQGIQTVEPFFEVRATLTGLPQAGLLHGRSGWIRFTLEPEPLFPRLWRRFRQLLQTRYRL